jgi:hypothetical protein
MDNQIVLIALAKIPELKIIKHLKSDLFNAECTTKKQHHRRKNVVGDIRLSGTSFILYNNGVWIPRKRLGINTLDELLEWVRRDIEYLSR